MAEFRFITVIRQILVKASQFVPNAPAHEEGESTNVRQVQGGRIAVSHDVSLGKTFNLLV